MTDDDALSDDALTDEIRRGIAELQTSNGIDLMVQLILDNAPPDSPLRSADPADLRIAATALIDRLVTGVEVGPPDEEDEP